MTRRERRTQTPLAVVTRAFPLIDIDVDRSGDGRTVTAYAATFADTYEVRDQYGHYWERINPAAFNRTIGRGVAHVSAIFNHGRTLDGTPSDRFSMPLGTPVEIRADARGLLTVTRYAKTPLADEVLELIADGAIRAQSFRGPVQRSANPVPGDRGLPLIERTELGLREYGPSPFAVNTGAEILALRSDLLTVAPEDLTDEERRHLLDLLEVNAPSPDPAEHGPSSEPGEQGDPQGPPAEQAPVPGPSLESIEIEQAQRHRRASLT